MATSSYPSLGGNPLLAGDLPSAVQSWLKRKSIRMSYATGLLCYYYTQYQLTRDPQYVSAATQQLAKLLQAADSKKHDIRTLLVVNNPDVLTQIPPKLAQEIKAFDHHLVAKAADWLVPLEWECLYRAVEVGYYLAHRDPTGDPFKQWAALLTNQLSLEKILDGYYRSEPIFRLGVEGLTGILLMLEAIARLTRIPAFYEILQQGVQQLLSFCREVDFSNHQYSVFPRLANATDQTPPSTAALTWSGSDLTQALLLYRAAALLPDSHLRKAADLIGLNTLLRKESGQTDTHGVNLYRGTAGVAQTYRALYRASRTDAYLRGYEYWITQTAQRLRNRTARYEDNSLLHGDIGAILTLLSYQHSEIIGWKAAVLL